MTANRAIVSASQAKFGKTLLGAFEVAYRCPKCKAELKSKGLPIVDGDSCPNCQSAFEFDLPIKEAFASFQQTIADRAEEKRLAKLQKEQAATAQKERWWQQEHAAQAERQASEAAQKRQVTNMKKIESVKDIDTPYAYLMLILGFCGFGIFLMFLFSIRFWFNNDNWDDANAWPGVLATVASAASLLIVLIFFQMLKAIHALLVKILNQLRMQADERNGSP
jgi:uncharacterized Zn finger protein (UPF0148 family)